MYVVTTFDIGRVFALRRFLENAVNTLALLLEQMRCLSTLLWKLKLSGKSKNKPGFLNFSSTYHTSIRVLKKIIEIVYNQ